jgi:hypothetical protein
MAADAGEVVGLRRRIQGVKPAAGAAYQLPTPGAVQRRLISVTFRFATSATAINRNPYLQLTDPDGNILWIASGNANIAASLTVRWTFIAGAPAQVAFGTSFFSSGCADTYWQPGDVFSINAESIQAADQIDQVVLDYVDLTQGPDAYHVGREPRITPAPYEYAPTPLRVH